jgi:hypothetical protein
MGYPTRSTFPTHSDCANFRNGLCILNNVAVDPKGAVCPHFTSKSMMATPQEVKPEVLRPRQFYQPPATQGHLPHHTPQTGYSLLSPYGYRTLYNSGSVPLGRTALVRGGADFLFFSGDRRGGGRLGVGGGGRGRMGGGVAAGPGGFCVCPSCGYRASHVRGIPCYQQTCPKCGSRMTRGS